MVSREGYYDYMIRRHREEDEKNKSPANISTEKSLSHDSTVSLLQNEIKEMQKSVHALQLRVKELAEDNYKLKEQNANLHNNEY